MLWSDLLVLLPGKNVAGLMFPKKNVVYKATLATQPQVKGMLPSARTCRCISKDLKSLTKIVNFNRRCFYIILINFPCSTANGNTFSDDKISVLDYMTRQKIALSQVSDCNFVCNVQWLSFSQLTFNLLP